MTDLRELPLPGAYLLMAEIVRDDRGFFARGWSETALAERGLATRWSYSAYARNTRRGTLRGMHYQLPPFAEVKLVTCVRGAIWDVIVDLRTESPTFAKWHAERLGADDLRSLYVPLGFAHGYLTLEDDSLVSYQLTSDHQPSAAAGFRWDDRVVGIEWPAAPTAISERDANLPAFADRGSHER